MREAARRRARDSGTLSGTSAEEEYMTGKILYAALRGLAFSGQVICG
jgi:hypothetical protein